MVSLCYYVSLPHYRHRVLKCAGGCPDEGHERFYRPHFQKNGDLNAPEDGPYLVRLQPYVGDLVDVRGLPLTLAEAVTKRRAMQTLRREA